MFLNQLNNEKSESLFLDLAIIVAMSHHDSEPLFSNHCENIEDIFKAKIDNYEISILEKYKSELGNDLLVLDVLIERILIVIMNNVQKILHKYSKDISIQEMVLKKLMERGDTLNINAEKISHALLEIDEIYNEVMIKSAEEIISNKLPKNILVPERDKKIIIFELIVVALSNGCISEVEYNFISEISRLLNVDLEYVNEFSNIIEKLFLANKEAIELINE